MEDLIVNFTPTGMLMMKENTPYIPLKVEEIVKEVKEAYEIGITSVHLHARDNDTGVPCYEKEVFELVNDLRNAGARDILVVPIERII